MPPNPASHADQSVHQLPGCSVAASNQSSGFAGKQVAAPKGYGNRTYKPIEPAPGRYVKEKA